MFDQKTGLKMQLFATESINFIFNSLIPIFRKRKDSPLKEPLAGMFSIYLTTYYCFMKRISLEAFIASDFVENDEVIKNLSMSFYSYLASKPNVDPTNFLLNELGDTLSQYSSLANNKDYYYSMNLLAFRNDILSILNAHF